VGLWQREVEVYGNGVGKRRMEEIAAICTKKCSEKSSEKVQSIFYSLAVRLVVCGNA
jgi:hypothetical protein